LRGTISSDGCVSGGGGTDPSTVTGWADPRRVDTRHPRSQPVPADAGARLWSFRLRPAPGVSWRPGRR
jgi:hypothetical protein